jgi:putative modified peptide
MSDKIPGGAPTPLSPEAADRLLDLLSSDDKFRDLFMRDPVSALLKAGYSASDQELAQLRTTMKVDSLASKDAIAGARAQLSSSPTSLLCMNPIQLNIDSSDQGSA